MSNLYNLEPQPTAKVILQTTSGDLALELFAKQTPLASRNFLQHCLDNYYVGTIFHRLVSGFIIQGGDPTGTGTGGLSAINDGEPFQDEFHSRLKFNRRGLLGMANEGKDSNGSQFFLTLGATPELQGKHTMFGRIEGDTIYNLMKMADAEMTEEEGSERPLYPTKITGAEVVVNPFEDMVARVREAPRTSKEETFRKDVKKRKKPVGKNVLSFGGEEGDEELAQPVLKKTKANPKLVSAAVEATEELNNTAISERPKEKVRRKKSQSPDSIPKVEPNPVSRPAVSSRAPPEEVSESSPEPERPSDRDTKLERTNAEIAALKASMKRNVDVAPEKSAKPKSALEALIPASSTRGRKRGKVTDEKGAMDMFKAFKQRLDGLPTLDPEPDDEDEKPTPEPSTAEPDAGGNDDEEAALCDLHFIANCESCRSWDEITKGGGDADEDGEGDPDWMAHTLSFAKDTLGKDLEWKRKMEEIEVIDPREKARAIKDERRKGKERDGATRKDGGKMKV